MSLKDEQVPPQVDETAVDTSTASENATDAATLFSQTVDAVSALDPSSLGIAVPGSSPIENFGFVQSATALIQNLPQAIAASAVNKSDQIARLFFRCYVYIDSENVDSPYARHAIRPAPIDALRKLYQVVVADSEKLSESHFFRALHIFLREEMAPRDEALKASQEYHNLIKAHVRKEKKKIGDAIQYKQKKCYNGLKISAPNWDSADPSVVALKEYVEAHKTRLPTEFSEFTDKIEEDVEMTPPPAKRAKRSRSSTSATAAAIAPILAAVAAQAQQNQSAHFPVTSTPEGANMVSILRGSAFVRMFETAEPTFVVQFIKPGNTTMLLRGPDERFVYNVKGSFAPLQTETEQQQQPVVWTNFPSSEFELEFRIPAQYDSPLAEQLNYTNDNGVISVVFKPKQQQPASFVELK